MSIAAANRVYEDFEPKTKWETELGFDTLIVILPGFKKEQLKVQVTTTRKLRVMGERQIPNTKWIRFHKEFVLPTEANADEISARFEGNTLFLKFPKMNQPEPDQIKPSPTHESPNSQAKPSKTTTTTADQPQQLVPPTKTAHDSDDSSDEEENNDQTSRNNRKSNGSEISTRRRRTRAKRENNDNDNGKVRDDKPEMRGNGFENYRQVVNRLVMDLKKKKEIVNLVVAVLLVLMLWLYARQVVRSFGGISYV